MNLRVAPHFLFCDASESPSLSCVRGFPLSASSGSADGEFAGCPALSPSTAPGGWLREFPRTAHPPAAPSPRLRVARILRLRLGRCDSPAEIKPCIPGVAVDESLLPAGSCTFPAGSGCNLD